FHCPASTEVCNGQDDDCAGGADNTFACVAGATTSCTLAGCPGTQTCNSTTCTPGACIVTETCDRTDDDCDGFTDEDMLDLDPIVETDAIEAIVAPRSDLSPVTREVGVVYGIGSGPRYRVF